VIGGPAFLKGRNYSLIVATNQNIRILNAFGVDKANGKLYGYGFQPTDVT
jgi:hypothetical protein